MKESTPTLSITLDKKEDSTFSTITLNKAVNKVGVDDTTILAYDTSKECSTDLPSEYLKKRKRNSENYVDNPIFSESFRK